MRSYEIYTTTSQHRKEVVMYAYNGPGGVVLTQSMDVARHYPEAIELRIWVDDEYLICTRADWDEWIDHIYDCVVTNLVPRGVLRVVGDNESIQ